MWYLVSVLKWASNVSRWQLESHHVLHFLSSSHSVIRYGLLVQYLQMKSAIVSWLVGVRSHRWLSLQIFIELNAVVSWVCHHHMTLRCDREALWSIQWICRCVDIWQERSITVKNLKNVTNYMLYFLSNSHVVIHKIKI